MDLFDDDAPLFPDGLPSWPPRDDEVRAAMLAAWADGSWGRYHGPHTSRLEQLLAEWHGVEHALLCSSGTLAVELALRGLKVGPGDEVALAGYDFPGNFRAVEAVGAKPVLVDLAPGAWTLDPEAVQAALGGSVRAILASHMHASLAPMRALRELADRHGVALIEDACQAPLARIDGQLAGSWGDAAVLSFGGSKLLTAGRGGAVLTRRAEVAQRIRIYCERGNHAFPLSELQAATLPPQMEKLAARNQARRQAVATLLQRTREIRCLVPPPDPASHEPSYYKLSWLFDPAGCNQAPRERFLAEAQRRGAPIDAGFRGFVLRSAKRVRKSGTLAHSERAALQTVVLHHPILLASDEALRRLADALAWAADASCGAR